MNRAIFNFWFAMGIISGIMLWLAYVVWFGMVRHDL